MKKYLFTLILLLSLPCNADVEGRVKVSRVVDGDTIKVILPQGEVSVRLVGIDCAETSKIYRAYKQAYEGNLTIDEVVERGKEAKGRLEKIIFSAPNPAVVGLKVEGVDKYGRLLGRVYKGKCNVNTKLLEICSPY